MDDKAQDPSYKLRHAKHSSLEQPGKLTARLLHYLPKQASKGCLVSDRNGLLILLFSHNYRTKESIFLFLATVSRFQLSCSIEVPPSSPKGIYMQPLFCSAFCSTASKIYALKDDKKGHIINHEIHHLSREPDGGGPTGMLTLYSPTAEVAPRSQPDEPYPAGKVLAHEVSACPKHTRHTQWHKDETALWELNPTAPIPPHLPASPCQWGDSAPCCRSGLDEPSLSHFSPNQAS